MIVKLAEAYVPIWGLLDYYIMIMSIMIILMIIMKFIK